MNHTSQCRLKWYTDTIMKRDLLYKIGSKRSNIHNIPTISTISLNMSISESNGSMGAQSVPGGAPHSSRRKMITALSGLELLSCQKVKKTYAKKSVASFKLRKGQCIGGMLSLRRENMFFFFEKFCFIVLPKNREFVEGGRNGVLGQRGDVKGGFTPHGRRSLPSVGGSNPQTPYPKPLVGLFEPVDPLRGSSPLDTPYTVSSEEGAGIGILKEKNQRAYSKFSCLNFSGGAFLLYPELSNQYEVFESIKGFNTTIQIENNGVERALTNTSPTRMGAIPPEYIGKILVSFFMP